MASLPEPVEKSAAETKTPPAGAPPRGVKAVFKKVRPTRAPETQFQKLLKEVRAKRPKAEIKAIEKAYEVAEEAHRGQLRKSGHEFITHPLGVATIVAQLGLDEP